MPASVTPIASFPTSAGNGTEPDGQLFIASGNLIGATVHGGANGIGTTYKIVNTPTPTFLADIPNGLNTLVGVPNLSADAIGDLFGLEITGGTNHFGTIVEFPAAGGAPTTLANFAGGAAGGAHPGGRLLVDASGNLFGTTASGGANNAGTVFEIEKIGGGYAATPITLSSFSASITPSGSGNLVEDAAGDLFGTTTSSVFEVRKTGASYAPPVDLVPFPVGAQVGSLTIDTLGDIFGTTGNNGGTVFEIEKTGSVYAHTPTTLASFTPADGQLTLNHPKTLIVDANGDLFGTTDPSSQSGGSTGGVVYEIVKTSSGYDSTPDIVVDFQGSGTNVGLGANVVADPSGDLFTTIGSGAGDQGVVLEITGSGFVTTPSPLPPPTPVPSDFNDDGHSDILFQNTNGQAAIWEMNGTNVIGAAAVGPNPGPSWQEIGTGDFNDDGHSDILFQNTNGQAAIWEMNGTNVIGAAAVGPNPGPSWQEIGTGDFNDDGHSDILFQNTNGQAAIWEMNGTNVIGAAAVGPNPGPSWKVVGTGDFNDDGHSDILFQNTNGQAAIWEMNGTNVIGAAAVGPNPGPSWKAIGTSDYNGDGFSDILWQNTSGQAAIWEMNGTNVIGAAAVGPNPGPSWHAIKA
jgi:uncharacterized repeat protein (TIGR03803 family)